MKIIKYQYYKTIIGELILGSFEEKLCLLDFRYRKMRSTVDKRIKEGLNAHFVEDYCEIIESAKKQFEEYIEGFRNKFEIPILTIGSVFQKYVWKALMNVEYGQTASYLDLAKSINNKNACRAVASANGSNAIAIIIPCHRIIGNNGELVGYSGGLLVKKKLLDIEAKFIIST